MMTKNQVLEIITKMTACLRQSPIENELGDIASDVWIEKLLPLNFETAKKVVDIRMNNSPFFPTINEFMEIYKNIPQELKQTKEYCYICNNNGIVFHSRNKELNKKANEFYNDDEPCIITSHCICEHGEAHKCSSRSILDYFTTEEIEKVKAINIFKKRNQP
jgi:hypothetical protein